MVVPATPSAPTRDTGFFFSPTGADGANEGPGACESLSPTSSFVGLSLSPRCASVSAAASTGFGLRSFLAVGKSPKSPLPPNMIDTGSLNRYALKAVRMMGLVFVTQQQYGSTTESRW
mmetsp:Transcript_47978/g.144975  ORF Transcript_47978/g.144975 Transcript_47978/m.144975 type:complete len:118 (+) Transcript_47978:1293-1646(+)